MYTLNERVSKLYRSTAKRIGVKDVTQPSLYLTDFIYLTELCKRYMYHFNYYFIESYALSAKEINLLLQRYLFVLQRK